MIMLILILLMIIVAKIIYGIYTVIWNAYYKMKIDNLIEDINTKEDLLFTNYKDFINVIAEAFKRKGYTVKFTDKCGEECNGLILNDIQYVEVWKHGLDQVIEVEAAMKLSKCMQLNSIYRGMLVTLGDFKQNTRSFCHKSVIECMNGDQLLAMCKEVQRRKEVVQASKV